MDAINNRHTHTCPLRRLADVSGRWSRSGLSPPGFLARGRSRFDRRPPAEPLGIARVEGAQGAVPDEGVEAEVAPEVVVVAGVEGAGLELAEDRPAGA